MPQNVGFGFQFRRPTRVVGVTLVVLVAMFVVSALSVRALGPDSDGYGLYHALWLDPDAVLHGRKVWGLLTYALLHNPADAHHLVFNALGLYFFGPQLEELWGRRRFVLFMVLGALGGSAFAMGATLVGLRGPFPVLGFSGVVMAVLVAWGLTFPQQQMWLLFFPLKGLHMVYVTIALEALGALAMDGVASSAHFGGIAVGAGWVLTQRGALRRWWLERRLRRLQAQRDALRGASSGRRASGPALRVIRGGADDEPPKDKRYLN